MHVPIDRKIRVLLVDDSIVDRRILTAELNSTASIEVVATASNGVLALEELARTAVDLVVLDIEMPVMDGLATLSVLKAKHPSVAVIMYSGLNEHDARRGLEAMSLGAVDLVHKPGPGQTLFDAEIASRITSICRPSPHGPPSALPGRTEATGPMHAGQATTGLDLVVVGSSTGGPNALTTLVESLPPELSAPIVTVQHMPKEFTKPLAERLNKIGTIEVVEASAGDVLEPGCMYVVPGGRHTLVTRRQGRAQVQLSDSPPENSCRPSVDPLLRSVTQTFGGSALAVILTGMGSDGLEGVRALVDAGGSAIVQNEETSVVWGMPGFVAREGLAEAVLPIDEIGQSIARRVTQARSQLGGRKR